MEVAAGARPAVAGVAELAVAAQPAVVEKDAKLDPVCAEKPESKWQMVSVRSASIVIHGGFAGRAQHIAHTLVYKMNDGTDWRFVHLQKHAKWLVAAVVGPRATNGRYQSSEGTGRHTQ